MRVTQGQTWNHATLGSSEGTKISLDYQRQRHEPEHGLDKTVINADPVWLNVSRDDFAPSDQVRAVVIDQTYAGSTNPSLASQAVHEVDLQPTADGRFTAPLPDLGISSGGARAMPEKHLWQIAVVRNGEWQSDPASGTHNFSVAPDPLYTV